MPEVTMPRLSDSMEEGTILKWLKADGDEVAKGDELVEIETDKATMTYEADGEGTLKIVAQEGDTLPIGQVIAKLGEGGEDEASEGEQARTEEPAEAQTAAGNGAPSGEKGASATAQASESGGGEQASAGDGDREAAQAQAGGEGDGEAAQPQAGGGEGDREAAQPQAGGGEGDREAAQARAGGEGDREAAQAQAGGGEGGGEPAAQAGEADAPSAEGNGGRPKASPVARRIAREQGVDLSTLQGSGPGGRIVKADVEAAASGEAPQAQASAQAPQAEQAPAEATAEPPAEEQDAAPPPPPSGVPEKGAAKGDVTVHELSRIQQLIARRMAESKATVPDFTLSADIDMEEAVALRRRLKEIRTSDDQPTPSYNDMVVKACARALRDHPRANGAYKDGKFELYSRVNVGVAVAAMDSLVVPTVFDADRKSLGEIARDTRTLAERVRAGAITPPELGGGTFTVSNLGMYGISAFTAVINPPQAAILAVGEMTPRPVVRDGKVVPRATMSVTLACDHRILYGADAAEFLGHVRRLLEQPLALAL